jgi:CheY-like chemotaxis protein
MQEDSAPGHAGATLSAHERVHVLVVEDELVIRMLISDALRDEGYNVIEAFNGDEAVDILNAGLAVDLIVSDVRMPGSLDGLGLLDFARQHFPVLPIILTSGHLQPSLAMAKGATHFLDKPFLIESLLRLVAAELSEPE